MSNTLASSVEAIWKGGGSSTITCTPSATFHWSAGDQQSAVLLKKTEAAKSP